MKRKICYAKILICDAHSLTKCEQTVMEEPTHFLRTYKKKNTKNKRGKQNLSNYCHYYSILKYSADS